jgi:hypothetical protein
VGYSLRLEPLLEPLLYSRRRVGLGSFCGVLMPKVLLGATLTVIGLALGGCASVQTSSVAAADPVPDQALDVASPEAGAPQTTEELDPGAPSPRRTPAPRRTVSPRLTQTPPPDTSPPQARVGQEVTGAERRDVGPSTEASSMEEQRRRKQLEEDSNISKLDQSAARALRSICNGC